MTRTMTTRNVIFALIGASALALKRLYGGPLAEVVYAYGGNCVVSFALYFAALSAARGYPRFRLVAATATLLAVTAFEITDGFGFMANVYDPLDLLANAAGVGLALAVDLLSTRLMGGKARDDSADA